MMTSVHLNLGQQRAATEEQLQINTLEDGDYAHPSINLCRPKLIWGTREGVNGANSRFAFQTRSHFTCGTFHNAL